MIFACGTRAIELLSLLLFFLFLGGKKVQILLILTYLMTTIDPSCNSTTFLPWQKFWPLRPNLVSRVQNVVWGYSQNWFVWVSKWYGTSLSFQILGITCYRILPILFGMMYIDFKWNSKINFSVMRHLGRLRRFDFSRSKSCRCKVILLVLHGLITSILDLQ